MYPPSPVPSPRKPKTGLTVGLIAAASALVVGAALVGLYVTGVIGPATADPASDGTSGESGDHRYDGKLCEVIDVAAFGPRLAQAQELDIAAAADTGTLDCGMKYELTDGPDGDDFGLGQLNITVKWHETVAAAKGGYAPPVMDDDQLDDYTGDWDEGVIGQRIQGETDVDTQAVIRDSNLVVTVTMGWSGAEFDAETLLAGVRDIGEQVLAAASR